MLVTLVLKARCFTLEVLFKTPTIPVKPFQQLNAQYHLIVMVTPKSFIKKLNFIKQICLTFLLCAGL